MKTCLLFFMILSLSFIANAQDEENFGLGVRWGIAVYKPGGFVGYPGKQVSGTIMYKDSAGIVIYTESHSGTLDDGSYLRFTIGQGTNPIPAERLPAAAYRRVAKLCWTLTVQTDGGPVTVTDMQDVSSVPKANFAFHSLNSERFANHSWNDQDLSVNEFVDQGSEYQTGVLSWNNELQIRRVRTNDFFYSENSTAAASGSAVRAVRVGGNDVAPCPMIFGCPTPPLIESAYSLYGKSSPHFYNIFSVHAKPGEIHTPVTHNTAAIYADNTQVEMSAGVHARGQTWGVYAAGQNGAVGITNGLGNGAGATGFVASAPDTGGFKYGLYANANSIINAWAAALFGNSFYTGTLTMSSDARLKTEIRSQADALDKVMQLKPSLYTYRQDTPYSLPQGLHHGFLAQDVEEVFPELVSDITMPLTLDPQKMYKGGTTEYKGINYIEMIAILTSALQELNTTLTAKIDAQTKEIEALKAQLK